MQNSFPVHYHYIARNKKQSSCRLDVDSLYCKIQKRNGLTEEYRYRYEDIHRIHLGLPDIGWHTIDIYFKDKKHIHLKSLTFFIADAQQRLRRPKTDGVDIGHAKSNRQAYHDFVVALHERIGKLEARFPVALTHGNPWKKILIWIFMLALVIWTPIVWKMGYYWWSLFFAGSFLLLVLFSRMINFRTHYLPDELPLKYLPS